MQHYHLLKFFRGICQRQKDYFLDRCLPCLYLTDNASASIKIKIKKFDRFCWPVSYLLQWFSRVQASAWAWSFFSSTFRFFNEPFLRISHFLKDQNYSGAWLLFLFSTWEMEWNWRRPSPQKSLRINLPRKNCTRIILIYSE